MLLTGFEPATVRLGGECSSLELQKHIVAQRVQESNLPAGATLFDPIFYYADSNRTRPSPRLESNQHTTQYLSVQACHRAHDHFRRTQTMTTTTVLFRCAEGRFQIHLMTGRLRIHQTSPRSIIIAKAPGFINPSAMLLPYSFQK